MNESWIKLHNKFLNWGWYKNKNTKILFIHCLLKANWHEKYFEGVLIPRGSFATSYRKLSEELNMTIQEIRTSIKHLISTQELTINQHSKFSIITIKNYKLYQAVNTLSNRQLTGEQQQSKNIDIINNINYINNILKQNFFDGKDLTDLEKEIVKDWLEEYKDARKIIYAIKEAVSSNAKELRYVNGILKKIKDKKYEELVKKEKEEEPVEEIFDYNWLDEK